MIGQPPYASCYRLGGKLATLSQDRAGRVIAPGYVQRVPCELKGAPTIVRYALAVKASKLVPLHRPARRVLFLIIAPQWFLPRV